VLKGAYRREWVKQKANMSAVIIFAHDHLTEVILWALKINLFPDDHFQQASLTMNV
jgi:hypothetical protein